MTKDMTLARRVAVFITVGYCSPAFVLGFIYQIAVNWFNFGRNAAENLLDKL